MAYLHSETERSLALADEIRAEIRRGGPMTFARFMERALYHPTLGYYRGGRAPMTRRGDYLSAPETHPVFGALLARFARAASVALGVPACVVEQGAGTGALARSFTAWWRAAYPDAPLRYVIVEPHGPTRDALGARLPGVALVPSLSDAGPFEGVYLSNELPDAFPIHRLRGRGGALVEVYVDIAEDAFTEVEGPVSAPEVAEEARSLGIAPSDGREIEVNPGLRPWMSGVAAALRRGYALTLDYGYDAADVARHPRGTLLAFYRHTAHEEFTRRVGRQDLTAHVCWTALERHGTAAGLRPLERATQRDFLTRWGWKDYGRWRMAQPGATHIELDAVDRLGRPQNGLGNLGALLQATAGLSAPDVAAAGPPHWQDVEPFTARRAVDGGGFISP